MVGPLHDTRALRENGSASIAELKQFLASLKGKSPQEVIGIVSSSLLVQSMIQAVAATVVLFVVFTVIPYLVYGSPRAKMNAAKAAATKADGKSQSDAKSADPAKTDGAIGEESPEAEKTGPDGAKAAKVLGIDEVKKSDPSKNPLDKGPNLDKLLDGVDP